MTQLDKICVQHYLDEDGYSIHVCNTTNDKVVEWRLDALIGQKGHLLYRLDKKPTARQHSIVEGDPEVWISAHAEDLAQSVM